jgi:hypothetical protein
MSQADESPPVEPRTSAVRVRFPKEMLHGIALWGRANELSRSEAIRALIYRGFAYGTAPGEAAAS